MSVEGIRKALKDGKLVYGTSKCMKYIKSGTVTEVFVSSNCPSYVVDKINNYAIISKLNVNILKETNQELGIICKKNFSISVACY